jgi:hypothetical protein
MLLPASSIFFFTKDNNIHSFKSLEYINRDIYIFKFAKN